MNSIIITSIICFSVIFIVSIFCYTNYKDNENSSSNKFYKLINKIEKDYQDINKKIATIDDKINSIREDTTNIRFEITKPNKIKI